jgi:hypothetical protein
METRRYPCVVRVETVELTADFGGPIIGLFANRETRLMTRGAESATLPVTAAPTSAAI